MKYMCLVYHDEGQLDAMPEADHDAHIRVCAGWVADLHANGRHVYSAGLQSGRTAATVRIREGGLTATDGPFAETKEVLLGLTIIEARDLNDAIQVAGKLDAARLGAVEVRPILDLDEEPSEPSDRRRIAAIRRNIPA